MRALVFSVIAAATGTFLSFSSAFAQVPIGNYAVPEPVTLILVGVGAAGVVVYGSIRKRKK